MTTRRIDLLQLPASAPAALAGTAVPVRRQINPCIARLADALAKQAKDGGSK